MYTIITTTKITNHTTKKTLGLGLVLFFTFVYFFAFSPSAMAAVSHSTSSESHTGTTGNTSSASFSWTHPEAGSPEGVLVFVTTIADADYITSVTYGGVSMTQVSEAADTADEPARMTAFFLGTSVPTGNQTIEVTRTNNATVMYANAATVLAAGDTETTGYVLLQNNIVYGEQLVDDGSVGTDSLRYAGAYTGQTNVPPGANTTGLQSILLAGTQSSMLGHETNAGQGSRLVGYEYGTTDDAAAIHLAVREIPNPYFAGTLYTDAGVTTASAGKTINMWVGTSTPSIFSTTTNSSGAWEFSNVDVSSATSGTPFVIWLDGDANDATTLVSGYSADVGVRNIPLYYDHVIAYGASVASQINPLTFTYDNVSDADILHFLDNGNSISVTGDFLISRGEFISPQILYFSGDFTNRGIFNANGGIVYPSGTGNIDGIITATSSFNELYVDNSSSYTIATTSASTTSITIGTGSSLVASPNLSVGNFTNEGTFNNNSGHIYTNTALSGFSGGVDVDGSATGTDTVTINRSVTYGNYLFIGAAGNATTCSQVPGSAVGCELQVYDVSDPTNMVYVAGRDADGSADGNSPYPVISLAIKDDILFVGKYGDNTACTQSGTNAHGCELMSFDITDPTNPTFLTSIDHDGALNGNSQLYFISLAVSGNYLYAGKALNAAACGQTAGAGDGCELQVFDISSSTNMVYVAGRDSTGTSTGSGVNGIYTLAVSGNYLYAGTSGSATACSQAPGSAAGCELQVYDISSSTNPIYVAGRDAEGDSTGATGNTFLNIAIAGNYLYLANEGGPYDCFQVAGSAYSCELQVYDISSSTNPIYVAGRDVGGSASTLGTGSVYSLAIKNGYLYLGKEGNATTCSQTPGSAIGCELQVYDISSSSNPIYVAGRDANGSVTGATGVVAMGALSIAGNYLYLGKEGSVTACSSVSGSAIGCEIMAFQLVPEFSGGLVDGNALNNLTVGGAGVIFNSNAETNDLTIESGTVTAPADTLIVNGDYNNQSVFDPNGGTVDFAGTGALLGDLTTNGTFNNLQVSGTYSVTAARASTTNLTITSTGDFTAPTDLTVYGNFNNQGDFDNNTGNLYMENLRGEVLRYLAGRDAGGDSTGTVLGNIRDFEVSGNYLYVGKSGDGTACSQVAGSAIGCELLVFDIASGTNPIYVAGRDASGSADGVAASALVYSLTIKNNYLYIGKASETTPCSQTAGLARGCELMVFDIASGTNPVYVAGRDVTGNDTGSGSGEMYSLTTVGNYLYVGKLEYSGSPCSQVAGSALGCEMMIFDIASGTNPVYVAGRDLSGSPTGTAVFLAINSLVQSGNYLYVANSGNTTACSQTTGSGAAGCELQVYDISSSTNPTYVAGRDTSGDSSGMGSGAAQDITIFGNNLYLAKTGGSTPCSQTAGSAIGCELQVYDISSSTNPTYVAGRDSSGDSTGEGATVAVFTSVINEYLYLGKSGDAKNCSQVASLAVGCELMVFDISSTTNPAYVSGLDSSGSATGIMSKQIYDVYGGADYLYVGKASDSTACSEIAGAAIGCEIMVLSKNISGILYGNLIGSSALGDVVASGGVVFADNASTSDLATMSGTTALPQILTVTGDYQNTTTSLFEGSATLYFDNTTPQTIGGTLDGVSAFPNTFFSGSGTKTLTSTASTTNLTITTGATLSTAENLEVDGELTNAGTFEVGPLLTVAGNYTNAGTFDAQSGTTEIEAYINEYSVGRDASGDSTGSGVVTILSEIIRGNYLYVGTNLNTTACSQTAGSAAGCELKVFDISDPTNPIYVAGRDSSGDSTGVGTGGMSALAISGNYLYVAKSGNATACSQTAGSAVGCELMVFDISSSTNPIYVAGRDASGNGTGTGNAAHASLTTSGNYLYVASAGNATACSQTAGSALGCEIKVFDISDPTNPIYVAGRDATGNSTGTGNAAHASLTTSGNYLYTASAGNATACSQTAGSALGCELKVYDISSSTNPIYVAGRDALGNSTGTGNAALAFLTTSGNYLYAASAGNATACSQTAGSALGCELKVYDISSSTNPIYVAGRDASGDETGVGSVGVNALVISGNQLYVASAGNATACSQTAGSALGCELRVFNISSSTNPIYVAGRDGSGDSTGTFFGANNALVIGGNYLYVAQSAGSAACSQTAGSASGCELMAFSIRPEISGNLIATSSFSDLTIKGNGAIFQNNASTTNFTIESGEVTAPALLSIGDTFTNSATFNPNGGEVILLGNEHTINGTTTFFNLTKNASAAATTTFESGSLTAIEGEWNFTGTSDQDRHALRSSVEGEYWYIDPQATTTISNLDVKDSNNINVSTVVCDTGCLDSTNNVNWELAPPEEIGFYSAASNHFYLGQATTTLGAITIVETSSPSITTGNDIRISIATTTSNFHFNAGTTNLTFGGTAAGKVSTTAAYEEAAATLVISVTENFAASDTLIINGITVGSFAAIAATTSAFELHTDGNTAGEPAALDTQLIRITGLITAADHIVGQVDNEFSFQNKDDAPLFAFNLTGESEVITVGDLVISLSGVQGLDSSNLSDFKLHRDNDDDGVLDGGDTQIDGSGILTFNGQHGAVTFSQDFVASTSANYLVTADTNSTQLGDSVVLSLPALGITALGATSIYSPVILTTVDTIQHHRNNSGGGGGGSAAIGGAAPEGDGEQTGGETGAGGGAGEEEDGENIAADPDFIRPTATGDGHNEWTNGSNALLSDGAYATAASTNLRQSYNGFNFNIGGGNTIQGIAVKLDASGTTADGTIDVSLSWDGGSSYTTAKATPTMVGTDVVYVVGGASDLWGRSWTVSQFGGQTFRLRVSAQPASNTIRLDALEVRVYHQAGGGSSGGGGGI